MDLDRAWPPERAQFLLQATHSLFASLDVETTIRKLADLCVPALADWCTVHAVDENQEIRPLAIAVRDPEWHKLATIYHEEFRPSLAHPSGVGQVIRTGKPVAHFRLAPGQLAAAAVTPRHREFLEQLGLHSVIIVPLLVNGRAIGSLSLIHSVSGRVYSDEDLAFAQALALRAAVALENARLLRAEREARARAERAASQLTRLHTVTAALASARTVGQVREALASTARRALGASSALVATRGEDGALLVAALDGTADAEAGTPAPAAWEVVLQEALKSRQPARDSGRLAVPLFEGEQVAAVLALGFDEAHEACGDDVALLEAIAERGAQALARARLEDALVFQKTLLQSQNEAALDGIFCQGVDGRAAFYNQRLLDIFGISADIPNMATLEERLGAVFGLFAEPEAFAAEVRRLETERDARLRMDLPLRDGRVLDCYSAPVLEDDGSYRGRVWFYRDVTARRLVERELVHARRQLAQSEKLAAMGMLVSGVAHEIRTPLAYMSNHAHMLTLDAKALVKGASVDGGRADRLLTSSGAILEGVERIDRLVRDLRRFARFEPEQRAELSLDEVVRAAARLFQATHPGRVRLDLRIASGVRLLADRVQLQQVVLNLLENAEDVSPPGGRVLLETRRDEQGRAQIVVEDEGPGVPVEARGRLFEPFYTTKPEGNGLGLSIVRRIVEAHEGEIALGDAASGGARFAISLPALAH